MPQFMGITKQAIQNMKEAVKCMEDFDLSSIPNYSTIDKYHKMYNVTVQVIKIKALE